MKETKYGNFSEDGSEFILTEPLLERPWMNVLSNGNWCYVANHLGGGYSFWGNPTVGRITRWHIDGVPRDTTGKFVYLRDEESMQWWTANGYPPTHKLDSWECHIGLGYNKIMSEHSGIASEITYFTPMPDPEDNDTHPTGDACEIWIVKITNNSGRKRIISTTNYVEIALGNWFEDTSWREFYLLFNRQDYKDGVIYTRSTQWVKYLGGWQAQNSEGNNIPFDKAVFMASSEPVESYEGNRYEFVGTYRDLKNPKAMDGTLRGAVSDGRDACEALRHVFTLDAGESKEYVILFGAVDYLAQDASELTSKYLSVEKAAAALDNNRAYWKKTVSSPTISTPDKDLDILVNHWFKYQGANLAWWNRNTGYCYSGIYNFGVRDACQDAVSRLPENPEWVRRHIVEKIMIWQFEDGDYAHGGNFISMQGTRTRHSDDPINPLFILAKYVRETGDYGILHEKTPYAHTNGQKMDTIYMHIIKGLEYFFDNLSERGLPLILKADWNDALDQVGNAGKGDSVMLACWAVYCINQFMVCMQQMNDTENILKYKKLVSGLADKVNEVAWDGEWYQRAMHDSGFVIGTSANKYAKIWANPNSFAIISGVADEMRREKIYESFDKHLDHELGSYTFYPPFGEPDSRAGIISRFAPGTKENGSIFGHSSRWRIWAECYGGRGDKAYEILKKMSPIERHQANLGAYKIEPYAACQFIYGSETDCPGEGSHSWATGTAPWTLIVVWEWVFGVRPEADGLLIDPCMPSDWTKATMKRRYMGSDYEIEFTKRKGICKGDVKLTVDGDGINGNIIFPHRDGKLHVVRATVE